MHSLLPWLAVLQVAILPTFAPGTEVRLVSPDLFEVYAIGTVDEGRLALTGVTLMPGKELRLLVFPPRSMQGTRSAEEAGEAGGPAAPFGRAVDGDVEILGAGGKAWSLREVLAAQGIVVQLPGEVSP